jgi:hypothetical protein
MFNILNINVKVEDDFKGHNTLSLLTPKLIEKKKWCYNVITIFWVAIGVVFGTNKNKTHGCIFHVFFFLFMY